MLLRLAGFDKGVPITDENGTMTECTLADSFDPRVKVTDTRISIEKSLMLNPSGIANLLNDLLIDGFSSFVTLPDIDV